jgi:hypothetical protein
VSRGNRDIHKIDNVLIATGKVAAVLAVLGVLMLIGVAVGKEEDQAAGAAVIVLGVVLVAAPFVLLGVGYALRRREDQMIAVWTILERSFEVSVPELSVNSGFSREFILEVVRLLNRRGLAYFVWDARTDTIVDGRLRSTVMIAERCPTCNAHTGQRLSLDAAASARCQYCGAPFGAAYLSELKLRLMEQLRQQPAEPAVAPAGAQAGKFSMVTFLVLLFIFWPLGIAYATRRAGGIQGLRFGP